MGEIYITFPTTATVAAALRVSRLLFHVEVISQKIHGLHCCAWYTVVTSVQLTLYLCDVVFIFGITTQSAFYVNLYRAVIGPSG